MKAVVFRAENGEWFFRLLAGNNEIVAQSEGYRKRSDAISTLAAITDEGIESVSIEEGSEEE